LRPYAEDPKKHLLEARYEGDGFNLMEIGSLEVELAKEKPGVLRGNIFSDSWRFARVFQYKINRGGECRSHLLPFPTRYQNFMCLRSFPSTSASVASLGWTTFRKTLRLAQMARICTTAKLITPTSSEARQDTLPISEAMKASSTSRATTELPKDRPLKPSYVDIVDPFWRRKTCNLWGGLAISVARWMYAFLEMKWRWSWEKTKLLFIRVFFQGSASATHVQDDCEGTTVIRKVYASIDSKCHGSP
jgi:hypothetical protein